MVAIVHGSKVLVPVTYQTGNYTATIHDHLIVCSGGSTVTIPEPSDDTNGLILIIKSDGTASGESPITIQSAGSVNIEGSETIQIQTSYGYRTLVAEATYWHIIGHYASS